MVLTVGAVAGKRYADRPDNADVSGAAANGAVSASSVSASSASASSAGASGCWEESEIRSDQFTLRGASGSIHDMTVERLDDCHYRVLVQIGERSLDYVADFPAGEQPTFIRYNRPP